MICCVKFRRDFRFCFFFLKKHRSQLDAGNAAVNVRIFREGGGSTSAVPVGGNRLGRCIPHREALGEFAALKETDGNERSLSLREPRSLRIKELRNLIFLLIDSIII